VGIAQRRVGQSIGRVMRFATAAVETLFEQAHFGFEFGEALLEFRFALLQACGGAGLVVGQLFFEFGFAQGGAGGWWRVFVVTAC